MRSEVRVLPPDTPVRPVSLRPVPAVSAQVAPAPATREDGYAAGYRDGEAAGRSQALSDARVILDHLAAIFQDVQATLTDVADRARLSRDAATRTVAIDLAEAVLTTYWRQDADLRRATLTTLVAEVSAAQEITLTTAAHPDAVRLWAETAAALLGDAGTRLQWRTDPTLGWTDLVARWDHGGWWGGLRAALWALAHPEEAPPV